MGGARSGCGRGGYPRGGYPRGGYPRGGYPRGGIWLGLALLLSACEGTLPPLRGEMVVGRDPYLVFVGGPPTRSDLYAARPDGGPVIPISFTPVAELAPALSPDGSALAFLRARSLRDSTPATVWVMSLATGAEREVTLPRGAGPPRRLGWAAGGHRLVVSAGDGLYEADLEARPREFRAVPPARRAAAESSLAVLLGRPAFARVVRCPAAEDLCVVADTGGPGLLARGARDPVRWGPDSVAYFAGGALRIRPLGPGRARTLRWPNPPRLPRGGTFFPGSPEPPGPPGPAGR